jgi:hypothetical protein
LAILRIEKVDFDSRGGVDYSIYREKGEKNKEGKDEFFHNNFLQTGQILEAFSLGFFDWK